jgi:hypothetical protein
MPKFFMFLGFWVGRFSHEEDRAHVHVVKFGSPEAMKVWLEPDVEIEYIKGINAATANKILNEIRRRKDECLEKWNNADS